MICPKCQGTDFSVIDSRPNPKSNHIRRRRLCNTCNEKFSTIELVMIFPEKKGSKQKPSDDKRLLEKLNTLVNIG